jgi:hypothetical protein
LARQKAKGEEPERHRNHSETIGARDSATRQAQDGRIAAAFWPVDGEFADSNGDGVFSVE